MRVAVAVGLALVGVLGAAQAETVVQSDAQSDALMGTVKSEELSPDMDAVRQELEAARAAVEEARKVAEQIVLDAQQQANQIRKNSVVHDIPVDLTPVEIQRGQIAVEVAAGTVEEIATAIMPADWRVMVDVNSTETRQKRFQFVSTKSRDQALRDLLAPIGLKHQYFFDLKDESGRSKPLLVISQQ